MISYDRLKTIIPPDIALANKAMQASLEQVKNIAQTPMPQFANTVAALETNAGLNLINSLTEAVPPAVRTYISANIATGTGPDGTLTLGDVLGCASGYNITQPLINVQSNVANINVATLTVAYTRMVNVLNGTYGNSGNISIPTGPGQGNYANANLAIVSLCSSANSIISGLVSSSPNAIANINSNWLLICNTVKNQVTNLSKSQIDYANLTGNQFQSVQAFADSLHDYGVQTEAGGPAEYINAIANTANQGGQAVVGALREGRNLASLGNGGLVADAQIPATPATPPAPGNLGPTNYTESQAAANIVVG
jgi:hypothetical protein